VKHRILGDAVQTIAIELEAGESVFSRLGTLLFVKGAVKSDTNPAGPYWLAISETLAPEGEAPLVVYRCDAGGGLVGFHAPGVGKVHPVKLSQNNRAIVKIDCILAATEGIVADILHLSGEDSGEVESGKFAIMSGTGTVFLHGTGNLVDFSLGPEEQIVVDGEMILSMDAEIGYIPRTVGTPGQEGPLPYIMLMHLTGPGRVVLHSLKD